MSHITEIKTRIRELDDLETAAGACDGVMVRGQTTHRTYGRFIGDSREGQQFVDEHGAAAIGKCEHAIRLKTHTGTDYEVGVVRALDGDGYSLVYDSWGPGQKLEAAFGKGLSKLNREYAAATVTRKAKATLGKKGFTVSREDLIGGCIRLKVRKR